jgi:muramoyltetrapeptide carboxypeptidase
MTQYSRRQALALATLGPAVVAGAGCAHADQLNTASQIMARRLQPGDKAAIVAPAGVTYERVDLTVAAEALTELGLIPVIGDHVLDRHGYFAGTEQARADDLNAAFSDPSIRAIFALRGGWGAARMLPFVDFDVVRRNPKVLMGYSDITTLLNAVYAQTGLVTFHGPNALSSWDEFTTKEMKRVVFDAELAEMQNPPEQGASFSDRYDRIVTINSGKASGHLVGGNLTLYTGLMGTPYAPRTEGAIIFLEEIGEYIYRCDRMLAHLALAGVFDDAAGVVFGGFTNCGVDPNGGYGTFSLIDVFEQHLKPRGIPCFSGAMIGHVPEKRTIPVGGGCEIDADLGTITLLEAAVT